MNNRQENKLSMAKTVQAVLHNNNVIVGTVPAFVTAVNKLDNSIDTIEGYVQIQLKITTGKSTDKETAAKDAIDIALGLAGPTKSYARSINSNDLYNSLNYSKTELQRSRDNELPNILLGMRDIIQSNIANLADFGITATDISALTTAVAAYNILNAAPRTAIGIKSAATKAVAEEFKNLDTALDVIDGLAEGKKASEPDFYNALKSARITVDTGSKGTVTVSGFTVKTEGATTTPLEGVGVLIEETEETTESGADGSFSIKSKGKGQDVTLHFTFAGFADKDVSVKLKDDVVLGEVVMTV